MLKGKYLHRILTQKREYLLRFKHILRECMETGMIRKTNAIVGAKIIKSSMA